MEQLKNKLVLIYLDWTNDFVSIDTFADYYNLDKSKAEKAIRIGRTINEQRHKLKHTPKQNPKPFAISV